MFQPEVLVVDDDEMVRTALAEVLTAEGCRVSTAADGVAGLEYLRAAPALDIVITDGRMPRMTGPELIDRVLASGSRVPMILLSGTHWGRRAWPRKRVEVIHKPVEVPALLATMQRLCREVS